MCVRVRECVCARARARACVLVCLLVCAHICTHARTQVFMFVAGIRMCTECACVRAHAHSCMYSRKSQPNACALMHAPCTGSLPAYARVRSCRASVHIGRHAHMHACMHAHMYACMHSCMHEGMHTHMHACSFVCVHSLRCGLTQAHMHSRMHACMQTILRAHMCMCVPHVQWALCGVTETNLTGMRLSGHRSADRAPVHQHTSLVGRPPTYEPDG